MFIRKKRLLYCPLSQAASGIKYGVPKLSSVYLDFKPKRIARIANQTPFRAQCEVQAIFSDAVLITL